MIYHIEDIAMIVSCRMALGLPYLDRALEEASAVYSRYGLDAIRKAYPDHTKHVLAGLQAQGAPLEPGIFERIGHGVVITEILRIANQRDLEHLDLSYIKEFAKEWGDE